jgi:hypothetical protein
MSVGYSIVTAGAVALAAGTAKTILGAKSNAAFGLQLKGFDISFDGIVASAVPALIEVCYCTWATNSPGTASTSVTPAQKYGRLLTHGITAAKTWTTEPTALTVEKEFLLSPNGGTFSYQYPLGMEPDSALGEGFALRITAPAIVNARATMDFERV